MAASNRGGKIFAGLTACVVILFVSGIPTLAETNSTTRGREDKSAAINLAIQVAQQVQAQQQANWQALRELKEQTETASRHTTNVILIMGGALAAGMFLLFVYVRRHCRSVHLPRVVRTPNHGQVVPAMSSMAPILKQAVEFERLGQFNEALSCYDHALAIDTELAAAYIGKGRMLNQLERYQEALACYEKAGQLQPPALRVCA